MRKRRRIPAEIADRIDRWEARFDAAAAVAALALLAWLVVTVLSELP